MSKRTYPVQGAAYTLPMREKPNLRTVSDDELLRRLSELLCQSRRVEADIVAHIAEVEERRLYAREAVPSMFAWCTEVLRLSDYEAYLRITVARATRKHPTLLTMLREGRLHLSGIALLARHLTPENRDDILGRAAGMTHRQLKELAAELEPKPDAPSKIRKLPAPRAEAAPAGSRQLGTYRVEAAASDVGAVGTDSIDGGTRRDETASPEGDLTASETTANLDLRPVAAAPAPARPGTVEPLAPARYKVQFTADAELRDKLERLQALMRSAVPDGDLAKIIDVAVTEKLERLEAKRFAKTKKPRKTLAETDTRPRSRYIPAAVRRIVHERDGGRCTYRDKHGRRCPKRHDLEFHHDETAFGKGGDHNPDGIQLMCRAHNVLLAEHEYGKEVMARYRRSRRRVPETAAV
jgi:hypothetical protein